MSETQQTMFNRRSRRHVLRSRRILKMINKLPFLGETRKSIREQNRESGRKAQQAMLDQVEKATTARLESLLESMKTTWRGLGYTEEGIQLLEQAWMLRVVKTGENHREDLNKSRSLMKQAAELRPKR